MSWHVYILRCADETLYTGITNNLDRRLARHQTGQGAKYTRHRRPVVLLFAETHATRSLASRREREIKLLPRADKLALCLRRTENQPSEQAFTII